MEDITRDVRFRDLFGGISSKDLKIESGVKVPDGFYQKLLDYFLERGYLNHAGERRFLDAPCKHGAITWLQVTRLPVNPGNVENYDLGSRWQGMLSTLHAWGYRLLFLLLRSGGQTSLFLGTTSFSQEVSAAEAIEQIQQAASGNMPGMGLEMLDARSGKTYEKIAQPMANFNSIGAVTGIPSLRREDDPGMLQTLDPLAFGIRDSRGYERDYALLVIADPIGDAEISEITNRMRKLGSEIHSAVSRSVSETQSQSETKEKGVGSYAGIALGNALGTLVGSCFGVGDIGGSIGRAVFGVAGAELHRTLSMSFSSGVSTQYLDKFAQYAEEVTDRHIERLKQGRSLGYWNTGVYVLGGTQRDIRTVTGMLRSIYSGGESYLEPIRLHTLREDSGAADIVKYKFDLIPLVHEEAAGAEGCDLQRDEWHLFGKRYQYLSTPMNTRELGIATALPRRDVPGLRFVRSAVRFSSNPAVTQGDSIALGRVVDTGVVQNAEYCIDPNALVRHALVTGTTGTGKTTTCKVILRALLEKGIPSLIIEPAKDDWVRWAAEMNRTLPPEKQFAIYMPGAEGEYDGIPVLPLRLNPYEPACIPGAKVDLLSRCENFSMLLNACLPSEEIIPILIDETVYETISAFAGGRLGQGETEPLTNYPAIDDMEDAAAAVMDRKTYAPRNKDNFTEILLTRFKYLGRGTRGKILNVQKSTDYGTLFGRPAVVNVSRLAGAKDKALVMSLLMLALYEYRLSAYLNNPDYRREAQKDRLLHLTVVEEAHNLLANPPVSAVGAGNPQQAAADLFSRIITEIREYGQGMLIVDQIPTKLIPEVIKNTNYKIIHRLVAPDDSAVMAGSIALREEQQSIIPALERFNAIICGDMDDAAAWVKMYQA